VPNLTARRVHPRTVACCSALLALVCLGQALWIHAKAAVAQVLIESAWERTLARPTEAQKPWQWADTWPVARLQWSDGNDAEDLYVLEGGAGNALAFGPGHLLETARIGEGASVIAGHRDTHFAFLRELQPGSELRLQNPQGEWSNYRVTDAKVMDSSREPLMIDPGSDSLTLITCYPFDAIAPGGPERYVVTALQYRF
jgi:sortase A